MFRQPIIIIMKAFGFNARVFLVALVLVAVLFVTVGSRIFFGQSQRVNQKQLQRTLQLDFESGLKEQIALACQMAKSPAIISYFENPEEMAGRDVAFAEVAAFQKSFLSGITFMINDKDLRYYSNNEELYVLNKANPESSWYAEAMNYPGEYVFNVSFDIGLKKTFMWINNIVRSSSGKAIGLIGTGIPLSNFVDIMYQDLPQGFEMYIFNDIYEITGARDLKLMEDKAPISEVAPFVKGIEKEVIEGKRLDFANFGVYSTFGRIGAINWNVLIYKKFDAREFFSNAVIPLSIVFIIVFINVFAYAYRKRVRRKNSSVGDSLLTEMEKLIHASKENSQTSQEQNAAVKEIVATMEDSNSMSETISMRIQDVSGVAVQTSTDVQNGVDTLKRNVEKLHEISEANLQTIDGIKSLGEKIENIWDIVTLINSVADQAKIIAFNAELEASNAGENGKNFHIVATEIRRLADGIIDGTKEIKDRIGEIQQSSDTLILKSEAGTEKVNEGCETATELESKFLSIKNSAEVTADSSKEITEIVKQQSVASEQILITLKQVASGVESFSQATERISKSSEHVLKIAEDLNGRTRT